MDEWLTYYHGRKQPWRSHKSAENVAKAIRYQGKGVRVLRRVDAWEDMPAGYIEVLDWEWPELFGFAHH